MTVTSIIDRARGHAGTVRRATTGVESAGGGSDKATHDGAEKLGVPAGPATGAEITTRPRSSISPPRASTSRRNRSSGTRMPCRVQRQQIHPCCSPTTVPRGGLARRVLYMTLAGHEVVAFGFRHRDNPADWFAEQAVSALSVFRQAGCRYANSSTYSHPRRPGGRRRRGVRRTWRTTCPSRCGRWSRINWTARTSDIGHPVVRPPRSGVLRWSPAPRKVRLPVNELVGQSGAATRTIMTRSATEPDEQGVQELEETRRGSRVR